MHHMTRTFVFVLGALGCSATQQGTTTSATTSCWYHSDEASCGGEPGCQWYRSSESCKDPPYCPPPGACAEPAASITGATTASAACMCSGGAVCFEQHGGVAQSVSLPMFRCSTHLAVGGDPCSRIQDQGSCQTSTTVKDACTCDNGIR
jgi:hypothetical protein